MRSGRKNGGQAHGVVHELHRLRSDVIACCAAHRCTRNQTVASENRYEDSGSQNHLPRVIHYRSIVHSVSMIILNMDIINFKSIVNTNLGEHE
jgi:hypothetical protein